MSIAPSTSVAAGPQPAPHYAASGTVLELPGREPELCRAVLNSSPPRCDGFRLAGWDWAVADGEETLNGTTWGDFRVVGTWDSQARTLTLTEPPGPREPLRSRFSTEVDRQRVLEGCPAPSGGWRSVDPTTTNMAGTSAADAALQGHPDNAGSFIAYPGLPQLYDGWQAGEEQLANDPTNWLFVALTTGDPAGIERLVRQHWGGPLCVAYAKHTSAGLQAIQAEIERSDPWMMSVGVDVLCNCVELQRVTSDGSTEAQYAARFGPGAVRIEPFLTPTANPSPNSRQ